MSRDLTDIYGPVIHAYTRADALADGALVDVTAMAHEAGIPAVVSSVALTRAVWVDCVQWSEAIEHRKREGTGQDEQGRLWDVVRMLAVYGTVRQRATGAPVPELVYPLLRVPAEGRGVVARRVVLKALSGPGDDGEPVITVMFPGED